MMPRRRAVIVGQRVPTEELTMAYTTYIRPIIESGSIVFNPYKKKDINVLEKMQNNFTRKLLVRVGGFHYSRIPRSTIEINI